MRSVIVSFVSMMFCMVAPIAAAHHGFSAHYDPDKVIRIEGSVKQFDFINPHGFLHIETVNDAGEPAVYVCDLQARNQLVRKGADESLFKVGEHIVVMAFAARRDPLRCEFGVAYFSDGSSFTMRSIDEARTQFADNEAADLASGESRTIFGVWIRPGMFGDASGRGKSGGNDSITAAGKAAVAAYDPITEDPTLNCEEASPVRAWGRPGLATSFHQEGDKIIIYHESMDTTRTVYLDQTEHVVDVQPSAMGHSTADFENGVLEIDTSAFTNGVLAGSIVHTNQMKLHERISIQEELGRLLIEWTVIDPPYYAEPLTGSQVLQSTSQEIIRYDCIPGEPTEHE
jgi:hypothetical protein